MSRRIGQSFREQQHASRYPFADTATLVSDTGQQLDRDMFIDASLFPIGNTESLHISEIAVDAEIVTISISNANAVLVATSEMDLTDLSENMRVFDLHGVDAGLLVSDTNRLSRFGSWTQGIHIFPIGNAEFVASCVIPVPAPGVRGLQLDDGTILRNEVWLVGENGVVFRPDPEDEDVIRMDVVGDPLFRRQLCTPLDLFDTPRFIRTINGCPPDEYGDFQLAVGDHLNAETIVRIYPSGDGSLIIEAIGDTTV